MNLLGFLLFSRFTSEALLFEALVIFTLLAIYAAFLVLRKRKFGSLKTQIPAGVVKDYLNELIGDAERFVRNSSDFSTPRRSCCGAEHLRSNLGTIVAVQALEFPQARCSKQLRAGGGDPAAVQPLEAKLAAQAKQIETFLADKARSKKNWKTPTKAIPVLTKTPMSWKASR